METACGEKSMGWESEGAWAIINGPCGLGQDFSPPGFHHKVKKRGQDGP